MAHFAELDETNTVLRVIVVNNSDIIDEDGNESESIGIKFCQDLLGGRWIQTSYNGKIRGRYAGEGMEYIEDLDIFRFKQPFPSWSWSVEENDWVPPVPRPNDDLMYQWSEDNKDWQAIIFDTPEEDSKDLEVLIFEVPD